MEIVKNVVLDIMAVIIQLLFNLGFVKASQALLNFARVHIKREEPIHFCDWAMVKQGDDMVLQCRTCGKIVK